MPVSGTTKFLLFTVTYTVDQVNALDTNLIDGKPNVSRFSAAANNCGNFGFQDPNAFGSVMPSQLSGFPIINPLVNIIKIHYVDGTLLALAEQPAAIEQDPVNLHYLGGYFASWSFYNGQNYGYQQISLDQLNTINYAFVYFDTSDGHVYAGDCITPTARNPCCMPSLRCCGIPATTHKHVQ